MKASLLFLLVVGAAATVGLAQAQPAALSETDVALRLAVRLPETSSAAVTEAAVSKPVGVAERPTPDLADPLDPLAPTKLMAKTLESAVFATTAVDHKFAERNDLTGSLGFLCGLQPGHTENGSAAAYGIDPHGRFLGAKLSLAF